MTSANAFDHDTAHQASHVIAHLNSAHSDTVLFVARHVAKSTYTVGSASSLLRADMTARLTSIDPSGADMRIGSSTNTHTLRLDFEREVSCIEEIQQALIARLTKARDSADADIPLTSMEYELIEKNSRTTSLQIGKLTRRKQITDNVFEITIAGLSHISEPCGEGYSFVLITKDASPFPTDWTMDHYAERSAAPLVIGAYYTLRQVRPDKGEIDFWIVLHNPSAGVAATLYNTAPGTSVAICNSRRGFQLPENAKSVLMVADESGTPAVCTIIESAPASVQLNLVLETVDQYHQLPLPHHPRLTVHWVYRSDNNFTSTHNRLLDATHAITRTTKPDAAFGAAETGHMSAVRRYVRKELGLASHRVHMTGYWRKPSV